MILTITLHPAIDRTLELAAPLEPGAVLRASGAARDVPAGKGVNVTRTLASLGTASRAIVAADPSDALVRDLADLGVSVVAVPTGLPVRVNLTVVDPDGTTTKLNEPGPAIVGASADAVLAAITDHARGADWLVIAGSLPPDTATTLLARVVRAARAARPSLRIAADTSGAALTTLIDAGVDLVKPNELELAELLGLDREALARPDDAVAAARTLAQGRSLEVLLTMGGDGAALVSPGETWRAAAPTIRVRSTVGAGDASLAGLLDATVRDLPLAERLRRAIAAGSAAASLPGTAIPSLADVDAAAASVHPTCQEP